MATRKLRKTFADYVAIALSPVLIMFLVGSLVFFLLEIGYEGQYESRIRWIMFWFVVASVLVGRISIEQGSAYARVYGLGLALAVSLVIFRFLDSFVLGALCLLGVIWWCTDKLTWDCTLIDDTQDASGEGLLQVAGIDEESASASDAATSPQLKASQTQDDSSDETAERKTISERTPFWKSTMLYNREESPSQPHAPGLWVIYFSLAALPLFGFGQLLIPAEDAARQYGFLLLGIYVAAALGLLLTTSFLGLRRYLRQRKVTMPASIAGLWVGMGSALILVILLLCVLLPRPQADYSLTAMIDQVSSEVGKASRFAFLNDDAGKDEGHRIGDAGEETGKSENEENEENEEQGNTGDNTKKGSKQARSGNAKGKGDKSGQNSKIGEKGGKGSKKGKGSGKKKGKQGSSGKDKNQKQGKGTQKSSNGKDKGEKSKQRNANKRKNQEEKNQREKENDQQENQDNSPPDTSQPSSTDPDEKMGMIFKWIMYASIAAVVLYFVIRHWSALVETLKLFWQELVNFWNDLFGRKSKAENSRSAENFETETLGQRRPFAAFSNPFASGAAQQMQPEELVRYTFEALDAWAFEQHVERKQDQTPLEFARVVGENFSMLSKEVRQVAKLYVQVAYANFSPTAGSLKPLESLWRRLGS